MSEARDIYERLTDPTDPLSIYAYMWYRRRKRRSKRDKPKNGEEEEKKP